MSDYGTVLAANVLNEGKNVSYRWLSRELKVHSNVAKQMLYDFHSSQNKRKPQSVHACYLIGGIYKINDEADVRAERVDGEDVLMQSSPYMSSSIPHHDDEGSPIATRQIILAREEDLEEVCSRFDCIDSMHVYSLGAASLKNLEILSDCNRTIVKQFINEDPLVHSKTYGVIQNTGVRRRTGKRPPTVIPTIPENARANPTPGTTIKAGGQKASQKPEKSHIQPGDAPKDKSKSEKKLAPEAQSELKVGARQPSIKREKLDIFKTFSKPKSKPKPESQDTASSIDSAAHMEIGQAADDEPIKDASEDEQPEDFTSTAKATNRDLKSRSEREEALRQMMDDEDEEMEDVPPEPEPVEASQDSNYIDQPSRPADSSPEPQTTVTGGRRRGRRKIMKKKTIKDEEGYLVTKEEPAWESFSDDEPPPTREKTAFTSASSAKSKKGSGKAGQGNITSFFGKR